MDAEQLSLREAAPMVCSRCGGVSFRVFPGPSGKALRCTACAQRANLALCRCGHGMQAHAFHYNGCEGATDNGEPCTCQARCPR